MMLMHNVFILLRLNELFSMLGFVVYLPERGHSERGQAGGAGALVRQRLFPPQQTSLRILHSQR